MSTDIGRGAVAEIRVTFPGSLRLEAVRQGAVWTGSDCARL